MTMESEWIEWAGGECPVEPDTNVSIRVRYNANNAWESGFAKAKWFNWEHGRWPASSDIIAYRLVQS